MLYFKSCLRCKEGTVELGSDNFGSFLACLTCGYTINSRSIRANGSIEEPMALEEHVVPVPASGLAPVAMADDVVAGDVGSDEVGDDFGPDPDTSLFEEELEDLAIEEEKAAAI